MEVHYSSLNELRVYELRAFQNNSIDFRLRKTKQNQSSHEMEETVGGEGLGVKN